MSARLPGQEGEKLVRSQRGLEQPLRDSVQEERSSLDKREMRSSNQSKKKAGSRGRVGVAGRTTLQTKVAVEGAVFGSQWRI